MKEKNSGKNFAINLLIAFPFAVVIFSILKILGLKIGIPITGSIILFSLTYLIDIIRKKTEANIGFMISLEIAKKWTKYVIILVIPYSIYSAITNPSSFGLLGDFIWAFVVYSLFLGGITFVVVFLISALIKFLKWIVQTINL